MPPLVTAERALAPAARTRLTAGQRGAVITMLTAATATTALVAAAGAGKAPPWPGSPGCGPRSPGGG